MKLQEIEVLSFKGIKKAVVPVSDTTVLVGANNAGKSSILQAIHFAARAMALAKEANKQTTLSLAELEYIPTTSYRQLGHNKLWGNSWNMPESVVSFRFRANDGNIAEAKVALKSARNEGLSINPTIPFQLFSFFRSRETPFSAYIPGIAGIPLEESKITRRHIFRKAASGDSNVVLRNILLLIQREKKLGELIEFVRGVYPKTNLTLSFNENRDLYIRSQFTSPGKSERPLEFAGTGFLHVVQVFAYLVLFKPTILLIDEPESHLHPTLQTRLTTELRKRLGEVGSTALMTTHSPFVARGLPLGSSVVWVKAGGITESSESELIKSLLGWGALDKPILLITEDGRTHGLLEILKQLPDLENQVALFPFNGVSKLGSASLIAELRTKLGGQHKVVVHRDRDGLNDDEVGAWEAEYRARDITPWVTDGTDIESYFCDAGYLAAMYGRDMEEAQYLIHSAIENNREKLEKEFGRKRKEVNRKYEIVGGSPVTAELIDEWPYWKWAKGKTLIRCIRDLIKSDWNQDEKFVGRGHEGFIVAPDLVRIINSKLAS